jgi:hypothetical protein
MLNRLKSVLRASSQQGDSFKEVRGWKRRPSEEAAHTLKKATVPAPSVKMATRNFFHPLRTSTFEAVKAHIDSQNLSYYSFAKSEKPIKAVIPNLPENMQRT